MREPTIPLGDAMRAEHAQTEAHAAELRRRAEAEARRAEAFGVAGPASTPERAGLPCPTCGGKRWLRAPVPHDEVLPGRSCPDCSDGVWTPPDSPVPRFPAVTRLDEELAGLESFHVPAAVNHLRDLAYASAVAAGWHDPKVIEGVHREPSAGERVALIHEEATELLGHIRDGYVAGHWTDREGDALPSGPGKPEGPDVELADIVIRCLDYAGRYEIDLGAVIAEKMRYNRERAHRHGRRTL